ncbi:1-deoxy-D-xylulose-5-phosphate synthase [Clostridium fallax]|uniref:1-deoxy-D-xylulose-5-phosphate synthase n=1 Tax=Clostridium fallax TaxID=1533 RepID=A0A1M4XM37_9CLOT|nr:1-deoxy-D-xylulose-5-phosphate synthase [Clostridium fallax]SHE94555.1 1-deoxy-D-xylulose-5-phosphate synthase [Clostridium fallax]SQB06351.1 1-deoxy-D-xylulose-5-phosphate synthase [Clostridium fallax]
MYKILSSISEPHDVKRMNFNELNSLSKEIRSFLIEKVSKTGGHLASNLGVVEITLSLFKSFDLERDKIVWDVGHQSYIHKILTGRMNEFDTLRQYGGLSGFPKSCESKYDAFETGHSSTSISAAVGMARARDILNKNNHVIAVIGDGALTGGMAFEALNDVGYNKTNLIVVLNDNQMSISNNVGGLSTYLSKMRLDPGYNKLKEDINSTLKQSSMGKNIASSISKIKDSIKQLVVPSMLFEDMGFKYLGPIDGHNLKDLTDVFSMAKRIKGPVIIHTVTQKGKGYNFAEKNPNKYHGIGPFNTNNGEVCVSSTISENYSKAFGKAINKLAKEDDKIVAITAAMPDGTGLKDFSLNFPKRFFDVGIAEQHATTLAAGMAKEGLKPVFAVYSTFLQRAFDQILHDICIQNLPVIFAIDRAGIVGEDGETHQGIFDLSYLSLMPNMTILAPKTTEEVYPMIKWAFDSKSPCAIRYPRGGCDTSLNLESKKEFNYGQWETIEDGKDICIIATGKMVEHGKLACDKLKEKGINIKLVNACFIKPIDKNLIKDLVDNNYKIITIEDNILHGGLGSLILEYINELNSNIKIINMGYNDEFIPHGKVNTLYKVYNLDVDSIIDNVMSLM